MYNWHTIYRTNTDRKTKEVNSKAIITYITYSKPFNSVVHDHLFTNVLTMGFREKPNSYSTRILQIPGSNHNMEWRTLPIISYRKRNMPCQRCIYTCLAFIQLTMRESEIEHLNFKVRCRNITDLRYAVDTASFLILL